VGKNDHILGDENAAVTLVEYGDYECPYCGMAHPIVMQIVRNMGPRLRYVFRHFPLSEIHPFALPAAQTAEFAGAHGKFWEMHAAIYANQHQLSPQLLLALAAQQELSQRELRDELARGLYLPKIQADFMGGVRSGVNGTPTFFINDRRFDGGVDTLAIAVEEAASAKV
jgi:protein-disulfide isomerase